MTGDTVRAYCEKKRVLVALTVVLSSVSFAMLCSGVLTDFWLHSREQVDEGTGFNGSAVYRIAHSGLWRKCTTLNEDAGFVCETINYFGDGDDEQTDLTQQIVLSIRRATVFPLICIGLLLAGSVICFIGHCNYRHKFLTFVAGILFIFSGLFNLVGIVLYIGSVTQEVGNRKPKAMEENPRFVYNYGFSFVLTVTSFVLSELTGVVCIYLYISRHKSALRKVQSRALLQRSHSEADVDAFRRRRQLAEGAMPVTTPATPTGTRARLNSDTDAAGIQFENQKESSRPHPLSSSQPGLHKSVNELRPMVGSNTPLMSTSAPRWCPPPPVRFVPPGSTVTPHAAWRSSLPRAISQPLHKHPQPDTQNLNYAPDNFDYSAMVQPPAPAHRPPNPHRRHQRRSRERNMRADVVNNSVISPDNSIDYAHHTDAPYVSSSFNPTAGDGEGLYNPLDFAIPSSTAEYDILLHHRAHPLSPGHHQITSPQPYRGNNSHTSRQHHFWRIPPPGPMSPHDATTTDDMSSTSVVDTLPVRAVVSRPPIPGQFYHTAHDRNARHAHKIKHKTSSHSRNYMRAYPFTGAGDVGNANYQDELAVARQQAYDPRRNQPVIFQRQQGFDMYEPQAADVAPGSLPRSARLASIMSTPTMNSQSSNDNMPSNNAASEQRKVSSAQVTHHRRTTPV